MADTAPGASSLAARCTACSTVFRVVPDQLRVSEGWVRCGRCSQVFNAAENLIDLDTGVPRRLDLGGTGAESAPLAPPAPVRPTQPPGPEPESSLADSAMAATQPLYGPAGSRPLADATADDEPEPAATGFSAPAPVPAPEPVPTPAEAADAEHASSALDPAEPAGAAPVRDPAPGPTAATPQPSFVRRADRAARWRQPRVRAALAGASVFAALLLAAQIVFTYRDQAAARWPGLRPSLEAGCGLLGCRVGPAQAIESLTVEASGLLRVEQTRLYQLTVGLRNRAAMDLAVPALELSLTDAQGRLLSRRVLRAADFGVQQATVAAGRDLALQATLQTAPLSTDEGDAPAVVGYTIELFYP